MTTTPNKSVQVLQLLRDLEAAVDAHAAWLKQLHRSLICGSLPDENDLSSIAHQLCEFGRWFHTNSGTSLKQWAEWLSAIQSTHQAMHSHARTLFLERQAGKPVTPEEYDTFMDAAILFKSEVRALQFRIMSDVCLVDHLTGAWNRNSMFQKLAEEQERMVRTKQSCCLCMMDLDHFKQINDRYGHAAGDKVLHHVVGKIGQYLRKYDSVFRYGGEEFLLCLPNISIEDAVAAMNRIREGMEQTAISLPNGETLHVTASFGIAPISVERSIEENINVADQALFCAKVGGRNRVCIWGSANNDD